MTPTKPFMKKCENEIWAKKVASHESEKETFPTKFLQNFFISS